MGERSDAVLRTAMGERSDAVLQTAMSGGRLFRDRAKAVFIDNARNLRIKSPSVRQGDLFVR
jgi:hypothetical protein